jgi:MOSC domain-containing protein
MTLYVAGLWRYPVKTLAGEPLELAELTLDSIPGDRIVHVRGPEGVRTSRRFHRLLGLHATLGPDGDPLIDGVPWTDPRALALVRDAAGSDAWLERYAGPERFDVLPLLVATDGAVRSFGRDVRRLRPNILIGGVHEMDEVNWPDATLHIGNAVIRLDSLRQRCPMTTVDPDTLERDREVLRDIMRRFDGRLALNADVVRAGTMSVGDDVDLVRPPAVSA